MCEKGKELCSTCFARSEVKDSSKIVFTPCSEAQAMHAKVL